MKLVNKELNSLLHFSAMFAYLEHNIGHYFNENTTIIEIVGGTQVVNFVDERTPSYGAILGHEQYRNMVLMDEEYFYAIMIPPLIDRSWILVLGYDKKADFLFYWATELVKIYQKPNGENQ